MQKVISFLFIVQFSINYVVTQKETYRAAVLEYAPKHNGATPADNVLENTREYVGYMLNAAYQGAQIIVFPEVGLTGWMVPADSLDQISTEVPDPAERISPCDQFYQKSHFNYSKFFADLSCGARKHKIYAVVNLIESHHDDRTNKKIYYNTNVAFDRNGVVIARYRKINLFDEQNRVAGDHTLSTFKTDFEVTFGMFICFDIFFKTPSLDILENPMVTDIVYSTAWFSELPYYEANSIQHGYAKSNGVNLLAAGLNEPAASLGGSGIYLADGRIAETHISGAKGSKLIVQNVEKIRTRKNLSNACQGASKPPSHGMGGYYTSDISLFNTKLSDQRHYTFKTLNLNNREISEVICGGKSTFCCTFNMTVNKKLGQPNYTYKLAAFDGVMQPFPSKTVGVRNCALVACLNESIDSCGGRHDHPPTLTFERISIKGIFDGKGSHEQPSTLNFDLTPSTEYMYCTKTINNQIEVNIATTRPHDSLLTFGIIGRVFDHDDKPAGPRVINSATFHSMNMYIVFIISIFVFLQQE